MNREALLSYFESYNENEGFLSYLERFYTKHNSLDTWEHCKKVAEEAKKLALAYDADPIIAEQAGWLHDIGTVVPNDEKVKLCSALQISVLEEEVAFPYILHQKLSMKMTTEVFGLSDSQLLSAIGCHTTLKSDMSTMDKVLFVADKLSWDQADAAPYIKEIRVKSTQSLDAAVMVYLEHVWKSREHMKVVHPWLIEAREELLKVVS
ncbi:bis(5'-nucleosyl)-tetraphosphatase (symmetrical) YqeK [Paenibacillus dakarensis]|uniref:bis(5'-nucleosyl)-tetraphosphatase (symmetrical) YqeK n=1 Tax=Paenibacillus dakarensis TaxID=1527293 RepID=UPI0006D5AFE7|nr:bis(5'-nucleosyl)-tetraphosphatase (symmetrical) YqeK [Paenibacillus dakarensis]